MADLFDRLASRAFGTEHSVEPAQRSFFEIVPEVTGEALELDQLEAHPEADRVHRLEPSFDRRGTPPTRGQEIKASEAPAPVQPRSDAVSATTQTRMEPGESLPAPISYPADLQATRSATPVSPLGTSGEHTEEYRERTDTAPLTSPSAAIQNGPEPAPTTIIERSTINPTQRVIEPSQRPDAPALPADVGDTSHTELEQVETTIRVSIGRIDVRAATPTPAEPSRQRPARPGPRVSLDAYLERSSNRRRR